MATNNNNEKAIMSMSNKENESRNLSRRVVKSDISERPAFSTPKKKKQPLHIGTIFVITVLTFMFVFLVMNYAERDNYSSEIAEMQDKLTELQKTADKLEQRLDKKNNLAAFEEYATKELGMVKSTELSRVNITSTSENGGETYKYDDNERGIGILLDGFADILRNLFD